MSASLSGAFKAHLESQRLGVAVYRDRAPQDAALPVIVVQEGISIDTLQMGDFGDPAAETVVSELVQVTLFEAWRDEDGKNAESYTLARDVHRALHGALLPTAPQVVHGVSVANHVRLVQVDGPGSDVRGANTDSASGANIVQNTLTCRVNRNY